MEEVTSEIMVEDLIAAHPELADVFAEHGVELDAQCINKTDNTLDDAAAICGFDLDEMLAALNAKLQSEQELQPA